MSAMIASQPIFPRGPIQQAQENLVSGFGFLACFVLLLLLIVSEWRALLEEFWPVSVSKPHFISHNPRRPLGRYTFSCLQGILAPQGRAEVEYSVF